MVEKVESSHQAYTTSRWMVIGFAVYQLAFVPGQSEPNKSGTPAS